MNGTQRTTLVSPWRIHCMYCGMPKGTSWAETMLNSEKIESVPFTTFCHPYYEPLLWFMIYHVHHDCVVILLIHTSSSLVPAVLGVLSWHKYCIYRVTCNVTELSTEWFWLYICFLFCNQTLWPISLQGNLLGTQARGFRATQHITDH